jgi:hypothetical protein
VILLFSCGKGAEFKIVDPDTGQPPTQLGSNTSTVCVLSSISQKNVSGNGSDAYYLLLRDTNQLVKAVSQYDSLRKKFDYNISFTITKDSVRFSSGEYLRKDAAGRVSYFYTRADLTDPASDVEVYQYSYNTNGYLVSKLRYVNGAATPFYETKYTYDNNNLLIGCTVLVGATLSYEMTTAIKPWLYLFPDGFEIYKYAQGLDFGKKGGYPIKQILTKIYDISDGSVLDTWTTNFSGYVYSLDNYILQTTASGDLQQGIGLLYGTNRFAYQCK